MQCEIDAAYRRVYTFYQSIYNITTIMKENDNVAFLVFFCLVSITKIVTIAFQSSLVRMKMTFFSLDQDLRRQTCLEMPNN